MAIATFLNGAFSEIEQWLDVVDVIQANQKTFDFVEQQTGDVLFHSHRDKRCIWKARCMVVPSLQDNTFVLMGKNPKNIITRHFEGKE